MNNGLIGVLDKWEKSVTLQNNLLQQSIQPSILTSKEHYLSIAKPCDDKNPKDFGIWLEYVSWLATILGKSPEEVALATSRRSLHKHVNELTSSGKNRLPLKLYYKKDFQRVEALPWLNTGSLYSNNQIYPSMNTFPNLVILPNMPTI